VGTFLVAVLAAFASGLVRVAILGRYRESGVASRLGGHPHAGRPAALRRAPGALRARGGREPLHVRPRQRRLRQRGETEVATRLLRTLARHARMMGAVARLRELATLAGLGWLVHQVLATVPERSRLRLGILRRGQAMALRTLLGAAHRTAGARIDRSHWMRIDAAHNDWPTIDSEPLASFGALLRALLPPVGDPA
jgi:hypothetical protein